MTRLLPILILCLGAHAGAVAADAANSIHALFRSADRGRTWMRSDAGLPSRARINGLIVSPSRQFAATGVGVFLSDDAEQNWQPAGPLPPHARRVLCLATRVDSVFAGTAGGGVMASHDRGASWGRVDGGGDSRTVRSMANSGGNLFAGLDAGGVLRSDDGGKTWVALREGLPAGAQVFDLVPAGDAVFAALYSKGLYRFDPDRRRWIRAGDVVPLVLADTRETLVAGHNSGGIFWSTDLGGIWNVATGDLPPQAPVWAMASGVNLVLAGAADGIYRSEDNGRNWARVEGGLPPICPGIAFLVSDPIILAAAVIGE